MIMRATSHAVILAMVREERASLADLADGLTDTHWEQPSLCALWRVRDVVAHVLSYDDLSALGWARRYVVDAKCSIDRFNQIGVDHYADTSNVELTALLRNRTNPRGYMAAFPRIGLLDAMIHHQDIRRAIDMPRAIPEHRLRPHWQPACGRPSPAEPGAPGDYDSSLRTSTGHSGLATLWWHRVSPYSWRWPAGWTPSPRSRAMVLMSSAVDSGEPVC
ncbi:maleylpyruvate isomerase family mycothiol-dependent enzyme [Mycolicibacterium vaccae]|nr:maleylpyruvate isomerase family mycothiol-dependent enzyme [Mycolicibacterium vaccae]